MTEIVMYSSEYRDKLSSLLQEFYRKSLNDYGLVMEEETFEKLEGTIGPTTFVLLKDGEAIGILAGHVAPQLLSGRLIYQEALWYVDENHRGEGVRLLEHLEEWCAKEGIKQIIMAFMYSSMPDRLLGFYEKRGYRKLELHLIKDVTNA